MKTEQTALTQRLNYKRLFNTDAHLPVTPEEFEEWFNELRDELEPERLSCDGEASAASIASRKRSIRAAWRELEFMLGCKVAE